MKKQLFSSLLFCLVCCCVAATFPQPANAQVEFSKFKLSKDEPFGAFPGRKMLNTKFKVTADRDLKYVLVDYYIVNAVAGSLTVAPTGTCNVNGIGTAVYCRDADSLIFCRRK